MLCCAVFGPGSCVHVFPAQAYFGWFDVVTRFPALQTFHVSFEHPIDYTVLADIRACVSSAEVLSGSWEVTEDTVAGTGAAGALTQPPSEIPRWRTSRCVWHTYGTGASCKNRMTA